MKQTTLVVRLMVALFFGATSQLAALDVPKPEQQVEPERDCSERVLFQFPYTQADVELERQWPVDFEAGSIKQYFQKLSDRGHVNYDDLGWLWTESEIFRASQGKVVDFYEITYKPCASKREDRFVIQCSDPVCSGDIPPVGEQPSQTIPDPQVQLAESVRQELAKEIAQQALRGGVASSRSGSSQQALVTARPCGGVSTTGKVLGILAGAGTSFGVPPPFGYFAGGPVGAFVSSRFKKDCDEEGSTDSVVKAGTVKYVADISPPGFHPEGLYDAGKMD